MVVCTPKKRMSYLVGFTFVESSCSLGLDAESRCFIANYFLENHEKLRAFGESSASFVGTVRTCLHLG